MFETILDHESRDHIGFFDAKKTPSKISCLGTFKKNISPMKVCLSRPLANIACQAQVHRTYGPTTVSHILYVLDSSAYLFRPTVYVLASWGYCIRTGHISHTYLLFYTDLTGILVQNWKHMGLLRHVLSSHRPITVSYAKVTFAHCVQILDTGHVDLLYFTLHIPHYPTV
jgi:hypothetical protein